MKNELSRVLQVLQEMHQKREEQKLNLGKLTDTFNLLEQKKLHMCKSYEAAMQERNQRWERVIRSVRGILAVWGNFVSVFVLSGPCSL